MDMNLIIIAVVAVIVVVWGISIYNKIITSKNTVERAWAGVITQERQKNKILPELEKVVEQHKEFESSVLSDITKLRSMMGELSDSNVDINKLKSVEAQSQKVMSGFQLTVEAYPELKTADLMNNLMKEISEQQENIGAALRLFNQNVELFNSTIEVFPNSIINKHFNKANKIDVFTDSEAEQGFDYKPNF
ncbi:LemA family protein [Reinekea thalattae]|nr:LemA family protein [Reinekea thalattae]